MDTMTTLEAMIDRHGLQTLLETIMSICGEKANHIRESWQDEGLARLWDACSRRIAQSIDSRCVQELAMVEGKRA